MVTREAFERVGGFDEGFKESLYDIDFCLKLRERQYRMVWIPFPLLSQSAEKLNGNWFNKDDEDHFRKKWSEAIRGGDPYYNVNLTALRDDFTIRI